MIERPSDIRAAARRWSYPGPIAMISSFWLPPRLRDAHGLAVVGIGPYVAVGGCVAMAIGGVMSKKDQSTSTPP